MMKIKLAALAIAGFAIAPMVVFAQSAPAPVNQSGPGVTAPVSSSTDMGIAGQSGNTYPVQGGIYSAVPGAAVVAPGYGSYAAVPGPAYGAYGRTYGPAYGPYGAYVGPSDSTYFDED